MADVDVMTIPPSIRAAAITVTTGVRPRSMQRTVEGLTRGSPDTASETSRHVIGNDMGQRVHNPRVQLRRRRVTKMSAIIVAGTMLLTPLIASCAVDTDAATTGAATSAPDPAPEPARAAESGPITITSADVPLPEPTPAQFAADAPQRIVSLANGVAETLVAVGAGPRVVGRDETSTAPQLDGVPVLTRAHAVSAESVLATSPDLVIVDAATSPPEALDQIAAAGVPIVEVPEAWTLADVPKRANAVARAAGIVNSTDSSAQWAAGTATAEDAGARPTVAFLYLRGTSAIYLLGGEGSGADALIEAAGGTDVGSQQGLGPFTPLTAEALAAADPDILLVMTNGLESVGGATGLTALPGVAQTRAGRDGRILAVEDTLLLAFGPRTGALVDELQAAFAELGP